MKRSTSRFLCAAALIPAFAWAAEGPSPSADPEIKARVERWARDLSDVDPIKREAAAAGLVGVGDAAVPALQAAAQGGNLDAAQRAQELLQRMKWISAETRSKIEALRDAH